MPRRLVLFALLVFALVPASVMAQSGDDTTPPTGSVKGSSALLAHTPDMKMTITVSGDDHGGSGIASIHLFVVPAGGSETPIRTFDPGKEGPQAYTDSMTWDNGLRELKPGKYQLRVKIYDIKENVSTATFDFEIRSAADAPKKPVDLKVSADVDPGLKLTISTSPKHVRGKLRVVIQRRNKSGDYKVFKKFSHGAGETWTLNVPLGKGAYRWQASYDAKAPYVDDETPVKSFTL